MFLSVVSLHVSPASFRPNYESQYYYDYYNYLPWPEKLMLNYVISC